MASPRFPVDPKGSQSFSIMTAVGPLHIAILGAVVSISVAFLGAWLNSRRELNNWLRDQRLHAATEFLSTTRHLLNRYHQVGGHEMDQEERKEYRRRMQLARSTLYIVSDESTVGLAEAISKRLHNTSPKSGSSYLDESELIFTKLTKSLRSEILASDKSIRRQRFTPAPKATNSEVP
jgi:hypothetical protein